MRYDIIINLDYENCNDELLHELIVAVQETMQESGFVPDGRRFTIDLPPPEAQQLARDVINVIEQRYQARSMSILPCIREFFGFEPSHVTNLLLPPTEEILVQELVEIEGIDVVDLFRSR